MKRKKAKERLELVLLYRLDETTETGRRVIRVLTELKIPSRLLTDEMVGQTVGELSGMVGTPAPEQPYNGPVPEEECLLMRGFSSTRIDRLLAALRNAGVPKIQLKAVITQYNQGWTFGALVQELKREHESMRANADS